MTAQYPLFRPAHPDVTPFPGRRRQPCGTPGPLRQLLQPLIDAAGARGFTVLLDAYVNVADDRPPYSVAMAVAGRKSDAEGTPFRVAVESDMPYDLLRRPHHYIGYGDDFRDEVLNRHGWSVVRFAERQLKEHPAECAAYLLAVLEHVSRPGSPFQAPEFPRLPRWTHAGALKMAAYGERPHYLGMPLSHCPSEPPRRAAVSFNHQELAALQHITPFPRTADMVRKMAAFTDAGRYAQDDRIDFLPDEHIYLRDGRYQLLPVSSLIAYFFPPFDALTQAESLWHRDGTPIGDTLDRWDRTGCLASELGTFVHAQTENYFQHGTFETEYAFSHDGTTEHISVTRERDQFLRFVSDYAIRPYRQEWPVFDAALNLAGTVDLLCRESDGTFTIYDWKRSRKVTDELGRPLTESFGHRTASHGVDLPDTSYYHYCMQQNLYRYMLEQHYGIRVGAMNLVVLCPSYDRYHVVAVPPMDDMLECVVRNCREHNLGRLLLQKIC